MIVPSLSGNALLRKLLLLILLGGTVASGQNASEENLRKELQHVEGADRIPVLRDLYKQVVRRDLDEAEKLAAELIHYSKQENVAQGLTSGYNGMGRVQNLRGNNELAIEWYRKALAVELPDSLRHFYGIFWMNIGVAQSDRGYYQLGRECFQRAIPFFEAGNHIVGLASVYNNLGTICYDLGELDASRNFHQLALDLRIELGDTGHIALSYLNLGMVSLEEGFYVESSEALYKALALFESQEDNNGLTANLNSLGYLYQSQGQFEEALQWFEKAHELSDSLNFQGEQAYALSSMAMIHLQKEEVSEAISLAEATIDLSEHGGYRLELRDAYLTLALAQAKTGDHQAAFEAQQKATAINDSIFNAEKSRLAAELAVQGRVSKKEREIEELEHEREMQDFRIRTQSWLWAAGMLLVVMAFALLGLVRRQDRLKKAAAMRQRLSELEQMALQSQMNPHFIFNCLSAIQGLILEQKTDRSVHYLAEFGRLLRRVLENAGEGHVSLDSELDILHSYLKLEQMQGEADFEYKISCAEGLLPAKERIAPMLVQPFVENAIRHGILNSKSRGFVEVRFEKKGRHLHCIVSDNGGGRELAQQVKAGRNSNPSMGLRITEERLRLLNEASEEVEMIKMTDLVDGDRKAVGTKVEIRFPSNLA